LGRCTGVVIGVLSPVFGTGALFGIMTGGGFCSSLLNVDTVVAGRSGRGVVWAGGREVDEDDVDAVALLFGADPAGVTD
jgi:hypothetical protein